MPDSVCEPTDTLLSANAADSPKRKDDEESIVENSVEETVIERRSDWKIIDVAECYRYRELLYFLVWRDVKVRYKQTVLGAAWAVLQPLATMIVFSVFLGHLARNASADIPYPAFAFLGLVPWTFFANAVGSAGSSIVGNQNLISKVYFPRLFIPLGTVGAGLVDLAFASVLIFPLLLYYGIMPSWNVVGAVPALALLVIAACGVGTFLSALTVAYRDFRYVVPFMVQLWMFATPCVYLPVEAYADSRLAPLLPFNPAYGLILNFRSAMTGRPLDLISLAISGCVAICLLTGGALYFRRVERSFADIV